MTARTARVGWTRSTDEVGGLLLFRVRGVPVLLAPSWWLGSLVVTLTYTVVIRQLLPGIGVWGALGLSAVFAILLGLSVLAHELGHTFVALGMGLPVRRVRLLLLSGYSEMARSAKRPGHEGWVAAAGPAVSLVLGGVFALGLFVFPHGSALWVLILECAGANLAVAVFNLLPGPPLDGGRVLRAALWALTGRRRLGTRLAVAGGGIIAVGLVIFAITRLVANDPWEWLWLGVCVFTAWFVAAGASSELAADQRRSWPAGLTLTELIRPVLQLPAESPVADALVAAAGRGVVLVRPDGLAAGLLDEVAAQQLAATSPYAPAEQAAAPIRPDTVLFDSESGDDIVERVRETAAWEFLVVNDDGRPSGVLRREDLRAALDARRTG
ncbi:MAG TPA: site-2 protease family protein [Pseudonocardiaceae bacterium]|nr:site-2 protease family protein [Pseudonocardiaceae bacterium]